MKVYQYTQDMDIMNVAIDEVTQKIKSIPQDISIRKANITAALQEKGLQLLDQSQLCRMYINQGIDDINEIVSVMEQMRWYFKETSYDKLRWVEKECKDGDHGSTRDTEEGKRRVQEEFLLKMLEVGKGEFEDVPESLVSALSDENVQFGKSHVHKLFLLDMRTTPTCRMSYYQYHAHH